MEEGEDVFGEELVVRWLGEVLQGFRRSLVLLDRLDLDVVEEGVVVEEFEILALFG